MESVFARATRYSRLPSMDPRENRLTEVTAAALEHIDGLAHEMVLALLRAATDQATHSLVAADTQRTLRTTEPERLRACLRATEELVAPRVRVRTQVGTPKGRFVDMEIWLRPETATSAAEDVLLWLEIKHGADIHGDQLYAYLEDIQAEPAAQRAVLLLAPRGQAFSSSLPEGVALVDWQTAAATVGDFARDRERSESQRWLADQYAQYLDEENLMDPEALDTIGALALMEANNAAAAAGGICEHADAEVIARWNQRSSHRTPQGKSENPDYGLDYWAVYPTHGVGDMPSPAWEPCWFEWGAVNTEELDYVDAEDIRGATAFYAGATFEAKSNPGRNPGNEPWLNTLRAAGFLPTWFNGYHRLLRLKYPDELLAYTTLDRQGQSLGEWICGAFAMLIENPPTA
jgi:hypothetical protein